MMQTAKQLQDTTAAKSYFQTHLLRCPIVAILRGLSPGPAAAAARALWDIGVELIEVTVQDNDGFRALELVAEIAAESGRPLGAGSIASVADLQQVIDLGAAFAISPGLDIEIVHHASEQKIPYLPGVATPTEIQSAQAHGISELKLFPARELGGARFLAAMSGPFPGVFLVPTGGVAVSDIDGYLDAGALGVGIGTELARPSGVDSLKDWLIDRRKSPP